MRKGRKIAAIVKIMVAPKPHFQHPYVVQESKQNINENASGNFAVFQLLFWTPIFYLRQPINMSLVSVMRETIYAALSPFKKGNHTHNY